VTISTDVLDDVWEDYNPSKFGPDIALPVPGAASSSSTSTRTGLVIADSGQQERTTLLDADTEVYPILSQQSFSDLNINRSEEDPYQADVDIAFDF
jgi:hypothetical protein